MKTKHVWALVMPALLLFVLIFLVPFLLLIVKSFQTYVPGTLISDSSFTWENYTQLFSDGYYFKIYYRTIRIAVISTLAVLVLSYPLSIFLSSMNAKVRGIFMTISILPMIGGAMIQTMGWFAMLMRYGTINSFLLGLHIIKNPIQFLGTELGVIIGLVQSFLPMMIYPLVSSLLAIDREIYDSARTLGARPPKIFFSVTIPLSAPGAMAGAILVFMACLTSFVTPSSLGQGKIQVFGTYAYQQAIQVMNWPFSSSYAIFFILSMGIVVLALNLLARGLRRKRCGNM